MREIKFRAWVDKSRMIFSKDTYGDYLDFFTICRQCNDGFGNCYLMQYTSLKDKNGKEIYEGDIINHLYHHQKAVIEWINCGLMMKYFDGLKDSMFAIDMEHIEIIGNIYENPQLLTSPLT